MSSRQFLSLLALVAAFACGILLADQVLHDSASRFAFLTAVEDLPDCIARATGGTEAALRLCYRTLHAQHTLNDFLVRREVFQNQHMANTLILWMVLLITISGVLLAALQLIASYQLAAAGRTDELQGDQSLEVARGKLVVRSSVTGLMILVVSLAFFYLYLIFVYTITFPGSETLSDATPPAAQAGPVPSSATAIQGTYRPGMLGGGDAGGAGAGAAADAAPEPQADG
jgi:hypothetical protein